jgi:hypothetical protein
MEVCTLSINSTNLARKPKQPGPGSNIIQVILHSQLLFHSANVVINVY